MSEYEIGHRRPPREHQFRKGQSGNPRGRPPKRHRKVSAIQRELLSEETIPIAGRRKRMLMADIVVHAIVQRVLAGKAKAFESRWFCKLKREIEEQRQLEATRVSAQQIREMDAFADELKRRYSHLWDRLRPRP